MTASNETNLGLYYGWNLGEDGWNVGMDLNMVTLGGVIRKSVISRTTTTPAVSPVDGDRYYVPIGATGVWSTNTNTIAIWSDFEVNWVYVPVLLNFQFRVENESDIEVRYNGSALVDAVDTSSFLTAASTYTATGDVEFSSAVTFTGSHTANGDELATMDDVDTKIAAQDFSGFVATTGAQSVAGVKTFTSPISGVDAVAGSDLATLTQVNSASGNTTASNVGGFAGVFLQKTVNDLEFKSFQSSDASLTITQNATDIDIVYAGAVGVSTFVALSDTPANFTSSANKSVRVNGGETALEFVTPFGETFLDLTDTPATFGTVGQVATVNVATDGLEFTTLPIQGALVFTDLTDVPSIYTSQADFFLRVNPTEDGISFDNISVPETFLDLTDTPSDYTGLENYTIVVNGTATALEFKEPPVNPVYDFLDLNDTPNTYDTYAGYVPVVNVTEDGLDFESISGGSGIDEWIPDILYPIRIPDTNWNNMSIIDNGNGYNITQISLTDTLVTADAICGLDFNYEEVTPDATERGWYFSPTSITTNTDGNSSSLYIAYSDGNPLTSTPITTFNFGVNCVNSAADQWTIESSIGVDATTYVTDNAGFLGKEIGVSVTWDSTNVVQKVYIDSILVLTLSELGSSLSYTGQSAYFCQALIPSDDQYITATVIETPVLDAGFTQYVASPIIDPASYPVDGTYTINGLGQTVGSVVGDVWDGVNIVILGSVPLSRNNEVEVPDLLNSINTWTENNCFQGDVEFLGRFDNYINLIVNDYTSTPYDLEYSAKYLFKIKTGTPLGLATLPEIIPSILGDPNLPVVDVTTAGATGTLRVSTDAGGGNFYQDGIDTGSTTYDLTTGKQATFIRAGTDLPANRWHIIEVSTSGGGGIDLNNPTTWTSGNFDTTIGNEQQASSDAYPSVNIELGDDTYNVFGVWDNIASNKVGISGLLFDTSDTDTANYLSGVFKRSTSTEAPVSYSAWVNTYTHTGTTGISSLYLSQTNVFEATCDGTNTVIDLNASGSGAISLNHGSGGEVEVSNTGVDISTIAGADIILDSDDNVTISAGSSGSNDISLNLGTNGDLNIKKDGSSGIRLDDNGTSTFQIQPLTGQDDQDLWINAGSTDGDLNLTAGSTTGVINLITGVRVATDLQTSAMTGGTSDLYIATKKYVDDNSFNSTIPTTWTAGDYDITVGSQLLPSTSVHEFFTADLGDNTNFILGYLDLSPTYKVVSNSLFVDSADTDIQIFATGVYEKPTTTGEPDAYAASRYYYDPSSGFSSFRVQFDDGNYQPFYGSTDGSSNMDAAVTAEGTGDIELQCDATGSVLLTQQTSAMNSGSPSDLAIATKKYVDDSGGAKTITTSNVTASLGDDLLIGDGVVVSLPLANTASSTDVVIIESSYLASDGTIQRNAGGSDNLYFRGYMGDIFGSQPIESYVRMVVTQRDSTSWYVDVEKLILSEYASDNGVSMTSSGAFEIGADNTAVGAELTSTQQTADMNAGSPSDLAIATKKYVDDNVFDVSADYTPTGEWVFNLSSSESHMITDNLTLGSAKIYSIVQDHTSVHPFAMLIMHKTQTPLGIESSILIEGIDDESTHLAIRSGDGDLIFDQTTSGDVSISLAANTAGLDFFDDGTDAYINSTMQTSAMNNSVPDDLAIATKKYVDDNVFDVSEDYTTTGTWIHDIGNGTAENFLISDDATYVDGDTIFYVNSNATDREVDIYTSEESSTNTTHADMYLWSDPTGAGGSEAYLTTGTSDFATYSNSLQLLDDGTGGIAASLISEGIVLIKSNEGNLNLQLEDDSREILLNVQTADMSSGAPSDLCVATKKYVDDSTLRTPTVISASQTASVNTHYEMDTTGQTLTFTTTVATGDEIWVSCSATAGSVTLAAGASDTLTMYDIATGGGVTITTVADGEIAKLTAVVDGAGVAHWKGTVV
ncbi:MAG: DUF2793 domain-containing protein [Desulfobacterales bacterium]|nr:DUF2793 domain-containing protein [Desulfobacterales bacterium]